MIDDATPSEAVALPALARSFVVATDADYRVVAEFLIGIKALRTTVEEKLRDAHRAYTALVEDARQAKAAIVEAETIAKTRLAEYDTRRQMADEAARAEIAAADRQEMIERLAEADAAEQAGDFTRADALRVPVPTVAPVVSPSTPAVDGIRFRETWHAEITDFGALVRAAVDHPAYQALLLPNMPALHAQARSLRARLNVPGVRAVCSKGVAAKR